MSRLTQHSWCPWMVLITFRKSLRVMLISTLCRNGEWSRADAWNMARNSLDRSGIPILSSKHIIMTQPSYWVKNGTLSPLQIRTLPTRINNDLTRSSKMRKLIWFLRIAWLITMLNVQRRRVEMTLRALRRKDHLILWNMLWSFNSYNKRFSKV